MNNSVKLITAYQKVGMCYLVAQIMSNAYFMLCGESADVSTNMSLLQSSLSNAWEKMAKLSPGDYDDFRDWSPLKPLYDFLYKSIHPCRFINGTSCGMDILALIVVRLDTIESNEEHRAIMDKWRIDDGCIRKVEDLLDAQELYREPSFDIPVEITDNEINWLNLARNTDVTLLEDAGNVTHNGPDIFTIAQLHGCAMKRTLAQRGPSLT